MKKPTKYTEDIRPMISISDVLKRIPLSRSTIERKVKDGTFPRSYQIAPMRVGFFLDDVVEWQRNLVEQAGHENESATSEVPVETDRECDRP
jgi:predicted DNA-binding transcriptional regulator AlpA